MRHQAEGGGHGSTYRGIGQLNSKLQRGATLLSNTAGGEFGGRFHGERLRCCEPQATTNGLGKQAQVGSRAAAALTAPPRPHAGRHGRYLHEGCFDA